MLINKIKIESPLKYLMVSITDECNKSCGYCFLKGKKKKASMTKKDFLRVLRNASRNKVETIVLMGGEPTIHPEFNYFLKTLIRKKFKLVVISNGLFNKVAFRGVNINRSNISFHLPKNDREKKKIIENIIFSRKRGASIMLRDVITDNYNFSNLVRFLKENRNLIDEVRLKIGQPNLKKNNDYLKNFKKVRSQLWLTLKIIKNLNIKISNCCTVPRCEFTKAQNHFFKKNNYLVQCENILYIDTDTSIKICPFHNKILSSIIGLGKILNRKYAQAFSVGAKCKDCAHWKKRECGPCISNAENTDRAFEVIKENVMN